MRCLPQEMPPDWNMAMLEEEDCMWLDAIKHCYDELTAAPFSFGSVSQKTDLLAIPLEPDGKFNRQRPLVWMSSGYDRRSLVADGANTGWCAERKLLENDFPQSLEVLLGKRPIWLLYLTRSPCLYCSNAIVAALRGKKFEHLVIAFEAFYGRASDPYSRPSREFLEQVRGVYRAKQPGIELFKVYRSPADTTAWSAAEDGAVPAGGEEPPPREVFRLMLDIDPFGNPTHIKSRRRNVDIGSGPLRRDTRKVDGLVSDLGDLAVVSDQVKDPLVSDDPTLRFRRIIQAV